MKFTFFFKAAFHEKRRFCCFRIGWVTGFIKTRLTVVIDIFSFLLWFAFKLITKIFSMKYFLSLRAMEVYKWVFSFNIFIVKIMLKYRNKKFYWDKISYDSYLLRYFLGLICHFQIWVLDVFLFILCQVTQSKKWHKIPASAVLDSKFH